RDTRGIDAGRRPAQSRANSRRGQGGPSRRAVPVPRRASPEDRARDFHPTDRRRESIAGERRIEVLPALPAATRQPVSGARKNRRRAMSLLMKALEKAAKDRVDARVEPVAEPVPTTAAPPTKDELTLEPLAAEAPASSARTEPTQTRTPASRTPARSSSREQAQAATVLQASASAPKAGAVIYLRQHPVLLVATIAVLIAIGFGTYVYLQIFHPALFLPQPPIAPRKPPPPLAQAPAPGPPAAAPAPATTPLPATAPLFPDPTAIESATPPAPTATPTTPTATPTTSAPAREKPAAAPPPERAQP